MSAHVSSAGCSSCYLINVISYALHKYADKLSEHDMFELFEILSIKRAYWGANKIHSLCSAMVTVIHIRNIVLWVFCCVFRFTLTSIMDFDINLDRISRKMLGLRSGCHHRRRFCATGVRLFLGKFSSCSLINQHTMKCQQNGPFIYFPQCTIPTNAITKCHIHTYRSWICWNHHFEWLSGFNMHET